VLCRGCNEKGFTLTEVIVVAIIVATLAAFAVPLYMGYLKDSRVSVGNNVGASLASAAGASKQMGLTEPTGTYTAAIGSEGEYIVFPDVTNDPSNPNHVLIPPGYTAVIDNTTAVCYFTDYGTNSATVYTYCK
jgi:prepilin-type N-terminal cleavage/methylation domain-containing protein